MTQQMLLMCEARLSLPESAGSRKSGTIEARITTWGPREGADGRKFNYQPEAFMQWAEAFDGVGRPLPMYVNHASDAIPVGEWTEFAFDETGMTATGRIYTETTAGGDLYTIMKESPAMFGGVSVGAYADEYAFIDDEGNDCDDGPDAYFQIKKGGLREVSVVMHPNNPMAEVHALEFFRQDGSADLKNLEKVLREAGLTRKDAVAAASIFKRVLEQRDVAPAPIEDAPNQSESDAEATTTELLQALQARELLKALSHRV
jgi:HK97 family phage prohead protease